MIEAQIVVIAKQPLPGRAKTRLCPPLTPDEAADAARACLLDTFDVVASLPVRRHVVALEGAPEGLVPQGFHVLTQRGSGLDERLAASFADAFAGCAVPTLLIGMDTPQITTELLTGALELLLRDGSVLGLAEDGGWWAIGLTAPDPLVFLGVPMSVVQTGGAQLDRMHVRGLRPALLPTMRDIDVYDDLLAVSAGMAPGRRVAALPELRQQRAS